MKYEFINNFDPNSSQGKILSQIRPNTTVLECGCATGYMTKYMSQQLNCQVHIIEYDEEGCKQAMEYAADGICTDLMKNDWYEKYADVRYDYILFADVLEHLRDPLQVLKKAVTLLKEDGTVLVSLPNIGHNDILTKLYYGNWDYTPVGLLDNTHVHFFGLNNLDSFFQEAGLRITIKDYCSVGTGSTEQYFGTTYAADQTLNSALERRTNGEIYQFILTLQKESYAAKHGIEQENHVPVMESNVSTMQELYDQLNDQKIALERAEEKAEHIAQLALCSSASDTSTASTEEKLLTTLSKLESLSQSECCQSEEIKNLTDQVTAYEQTTTDLTRQLQEERRMRRQAEDLYARTNQALYAMQTSRRWRLASKIASFVRHCAPVGSKRAKLCRIMVNLLRHPSMMFHPRALLASVRTDPLPSTPIIPPNIVPERTGKLTKADYPVLQVPTWTDPTVSIIIPVYNQFEFTYHCVESIIKNSGSVTYEILIADDCSTDLTQEIESILPGVRHIRNEKNLRFLLNCNNAATYAEGKYVLFLNNDTQVMRNWLQPLVTLIESADDIGMVGSKFIYPDGRLQEAGGIVWYDGTAWNFGNQQNPALPQFNYVKEADYISGASIMLPRALWERIGGFDELFVPSYCEDSDLAFTVRSLGYRVMYQPASEVVHFEGVSNGTDTSTGLKQYQVVNSKKLKNKWKTEFSKQADGGTNVFYARDRSFSKKTVLFVDHYVPTFDKDAGSRTVFQYIKLFVDHGYNVKFIGDNFARMEPYTTVLQQMGVEVLYGPEYAYGWQNWVCENAQCIDYVFLNRPHIAPKYIDVLREQTNARIIYYGHDLAFLRTRREAELTNDAELLAESEKWQEQELGLMRKADMSYYPSNVEVDLIHSIDPEIRVKAIPAYLFEDVKWNGYNADTRKDIMFIGGFNHGPNVDAVKWMAQEIVPILAEKQPDVRIHVLGSNPPDELKALESEHLILEGFVSDEELETFYRTTRMVLVPLRYGAGIKGKVIEALRYGTPVVTTSVGAEGIVGAEKITVVEDDAAAIAQRISELYDDGDKLAEMSRNGVDYITRCFSPRNAVDIIGPDFDMH